MTTVTTIGRPGDPVELDTFQRITEIHWPAGNWLVLDIKMVSSQDGGASDLFFDVKIDGLTQRFEIRDEARAFKRPSAATTPTVPAPAPPIPNPAHSQILGEALAFNYQDIIYTKQIVPGAGNSDHRNIGIYNSTVVFLDLNALRKESNPYLPLEIAIKPSMAFTFNTVGGTSSPELFVVPLYIYRWGPPAFGLPYSTVFDHIDNTYLQFATFEDAKAFCDALYEPPEGSGGVPTNAIDSYPGVGPVGSEWAAAYFSATPTNNYNIYSVGGTTDPEYYGDIYSFEIQARTFKSIKSFYASREFLDEFDTMARYEETHVNGSKVDEYAYRASFYYDAYDFVVRRLIRENTFYSDIDMEVPAEIKLSINKALEITGPEEPPDDPDEESGG